MKNLSTIWEESVKSFDEEFSDMTHTGHANQHPYGDLPCATMKSDVKAFNKQTIISMIEGTLAKIKNMKPILWNDNVNRHLENVARYNTLQELISYLESEINSIKEIK